MLWFQKTLKKEVSTEGFGLHSGEFARMTFVPAPPNTGLVFVVPGTDGEVEIPALVENVSTEGDLVRATTLAKDGVNCTVIDPRTTSPLDEDSIVESVEQTGRLVVVDEANPRCNMATDISALVSQNAFSALKAPIRMVTPPHVPPLKRGPEDRLVTILRLKLAQ